MLLDNEKTGALRMESLHADGGGGDVGRPLKMPMGDRPRQDFGVFFSQDNLIECIHVIV